MTDLLPAIPDPRREMVPPGWLDEFVPAVDSIDEMGGLDELEARLLAVAAYIESFAPDAVDFEKAKRVVEKRRGDLLIGLSRTPGQRTDLEPVPRAVQVDVTKQTATRWRKLSAHWDDLLWPYLAEQDKKDKCTQSHLLRIVTEHTPAVPAVDVVADWQQDGISLLRGDFRDRLEQLPDHSVDAIVTDPPYPKDDLPLWSDLAKHASRLLAPRGILFGWSGQLFLPEVIQRLSEHLNYGWTFCLQLPGSGSRIMGRHMIQAWKPIVAFTTGTWPSGEWGDDLLVSPSREKTQYEWEQNAVPAIRLMERFTAPDGLIVDPFLGVGSFGIAAKQTGRRFVGVELDAGRYEKAKERIESHDRPG